VNDSIPEDGLTKGSRDFERFCRFFRDNFDVVTLGDLVARIEARSSVAGTLAITFDDGYLDNFEVAAPILKKFGLSATFFVATKYIESSTVPWWDVNLPRQPGWMTWRQLKQLVAEGFDIGAHTRNHVDLGTVSGDEATDEISGSRQDLAAELGVVPEHFAFPYGDVRNLSDANRENIAQAGFRCCVSCHGGLVAATNDPFRLRRVPISAWHRTPQQFAFEILAQKN
jgi:peptidoglycan/xylan/chitin deacetylase (PgdA/CDA1 family)